MKYLKVLLLFLLIASCGKDSGEEPFRDCPVGEECEFLE